MNNFIISEYLIFIILGTKVQILSARPRDTSNNGFVNWPLTSVATWGERANGVWRVVIQDTVNN